MATNGDADLPGDPQGVWRLIVRSDDLRKYAPNRDPRDALAEAERVLRRAAEAAERLDDPVALAAISHQIRLRLQEIAKRMEGE